MSQVSTYVRTCKSVYLFAALVPSSTTSSDFSARSPPPVTLEEKNRRTYHHEENASGYKRGTPACPVMSRWKAWKNWLPVSSRVSPNERTRFFFKNVSIKKRVTHNVITSITMSMYKFQDLLWPTDVIYCSREKWSWFFFMKYTNVYMLGNIDLCKWNLEYANDNGKRRYVPHNKSRTWRKELAKKYLSIIARWNGMYIRREFTYKPLIRHLSRINF